MIAYAIMSIFLRARLGYPRHVEVDSLLMFLYNISGRPVFSLASCQINFVVIECKISLLNDIVKVPSSVLLEYVEYLNDFSRIRHCEHSSLATV